MNENRTDQKNPEKAAPDPRWHSIAIGTHAAELEKTRGRLRLRLEKPFLAKLDGREQKTTTLDRKMPQAEVVPGLFWSSQATILELWASPDLLGPPGTLLGVSCSQQNTNRRDRNFVKIVKS